MPYILHHQKNSRIYTCMQINKYELAYYGIKYWDERKIAELQMHNFLVDHQVMDHEDWLIIELDEDKLKIGNVKLKNNPENVLVWKEEVFEVQKK